jgi:hypothetical protein
VKSFIQYIVGLTTVIVFFTACQSNTYSIKGEAKFFADGTLLYVDNDRQHIDSFIVMDGHFSSNGIADSTSLCMLYAADTKELVIYFFVEPGNIHIELSKEPGCSRVSGTRVNNEWQALNDTVAKYDSQMRSLFCPTNDSIIPKQLYKETSRMYDILTQRIDEAAIRNRDNALGRFIANHKSDR